jgi:excisionase family DNA binding protein
MDPHLFTTGEVAELCGVTSDAVLKWIKKGRLPAVRTSGGHFRIARRTLEAFGYVARDVAAPLAPLRCWEHFRRDAAPPDACKECIVYKARIEKCYEVAQLGDAIGHNRQFCRATCENCSFFRASKGLAATVLMVTSDEALVGRLTTQASGANVALRFARGGYDSSILVETFHPSVVVMDSALPEVRDGRLADSMLHDERIPGVQIVIALRKGDKAEPVPGASVMRAPFTVKKIERLVQSLCGPPAAPPG